MNECLFLFHVVIVIGFALAALRLGKNALLALAVLQAILANLFVVKQMDLFGLTVTCSDVFAVGGILTINLLQEYFGKESAQNALLISFLSLIFFLCMSQIHLFYVPSESDQTQSAFETIFVFSPRIISASVAVFYLVQKIDVHFFGWLKKYYEGRKLALRMGIALFTSQFLDTVLFTFLGLYGLVESVGQIILMSLIVKYFVIWCSSAFVHFSKRFVKRTP